MIDNIYIPLLFSGIFNGRAYNTAKQQNKDQMKSPISEMSDSSSSWGASRIWRKMVDSS